MILRTPDERFAGLPDFPFAPHYLDVPDGGPTLPGSRGDRLRMHYLDEGPADADPVLLLHGQPTWCYLYRHVATALADRGHRVVAPDLIGFGRSDKPADPRAHTVAGHVAWLGALVDGLDLRRVTLVVQDWGGPIGLAVLAARPDRFDRVVATNTILHTADPALAGRLAWANHTDGHGRMVVAESLLDYILLTQRAPSLDASLFVRFGTATDVPEPVLAAYDAPFPDDRYMAAVRQMPVLIPLTTGDPGAAVNRATWAALDGWSKPFLTAYSDGDPASAGWDAVFCDRVPGAAGQAHVTIDGAGHFVQEDRPTELAGVIADFVGATPRA